MNNHKVGDTVEWRGNTGKVVEVQDDGSVKVIFDKKSNLEVIQKENEILRKALKDAGEIYYNAVRDIAILKQESK